MKMLDTARRWVTKANLALQQAGVDAIATIDPEEANALLNSGEHVLLVEVQKATLDTWTTATLEMRFVLISPVRSAIEAWEHLEDTAAPLLDSLEVESAQLSYWQPDNGQPYPCNLLTTTITEIEE